ncbi:MAG TPA: endonuclease/exonuclease/phosphatase family protein [Niabella sp.]|nr:endonuclease/exonuclease/phosphatase family protein [Niabella sp.]HOZ97279.1 endonuclease/exonuclease/phosphatase family protein [Niabella sp.]HQW15450.1 endonuclease/exonuclease/phosphatase family protein [Niabella sp.]HQX20504.1 endonuclease/exonuclease/phosphatase family protein [Niabella sp.]HQX41715.1 endonuclease/exonuclease/phosphatase family protein [Niabella sp.]
MKYVLYKLTYCIAFFAILSCGSKKAQKGNQVMNSLKVMTYNVHHCNPPDKKAVIDVDAIAEVIKKENPDIVAVQEVDVNTKRSGKINQAVLLAEKAGYASFYFGKAMDYDGGQYGLLILSKYPLSDTKTYLLPVAIGKKDEQRVLATATVLIPGNLSFRFGSTHLEAFNKLSRELQIIEINRIAGETMLPMIVAGDFNAFENSSVIKTLDEVFLRTCTNCAKTFDEAGERGAIDFIAIKQKNNPFAVKSHTVIQNTSASDHMPVVVQLEIIK